MKNEKNRVVDYTIATLIDALKQFPQDLPILVSGYEDGFENILNPEMMRMEHKPQSLHY